MLILVKLIGIIIAVMGVSLFLNPRTLKALIAFWGQGRRLYIAGILRILIGAMLLLAASQCRLRGAVIALGILFLIGGVLIFLLGLSRLKSILNWWEKRPTSVIRLMALFALVIAVLLLYSV